MTTEQIYREVVDELDFDPERDQNPPWTLDAAKARIEGQDSSSSAGRRGSGMDGGSGREAGRSRS